MATGSDPSPTSVFRPITASDFFDLGKSYLRSRKFTEAADQFERGLELRPQDFWLNFYQGLCDYKLNRLGEAINAFRVCIALSPESAECYYNRALAFGALGFNNEAIRDYTHALKWNPGLSAGWLNRGMLQYQERQFHEAADDLNQALATASGRADRGLIHYNLSLVELAQGNRPAALANLKVAVSCGHEAARTLQDQLQKQ